MYDFLDAARAVGPPGRHRPIDQLPDQRRRHPRAPDRSAATTTTPSPTAGTSGSATRPATRRSRNSTTRSTTTRSNGCSPRSATSRRPTRCSPPGTRPRDGADLDPDELRCASARRCCPSTPCRARSSGRRGAAGGERQGRRRRAARRRPGSIGAAVDASQPTTPIEARLCEIWADGRSRSSRSVSPTTSSISVVPRSPRSRSSPRSTTSSATDLPDAAVFRARTIGELRRRGR